VALGASRLRRFAVTAAAFMMVTTVSCSSVANQSAAPTSSEPPPRPELTQVTTSMFVDRSAVPNSAAMEYTPPDISSDIEETNDPVNPPECAPIFWGPSPTEAGSASWSSTTSSGTSTTLKVFNLFLVLSAERPDFTTLLGKCRTIEYQGLTSTVTPLPLAGLPSWSTPTRIVVPEADGAGIIGLCRGLYVSVAFTQSPAATFRRMTPTLE